jgi:predicted dehydrogenase
MSHPLDAANLVMDLGIPESCCATGGIYQYDDGRTVPDTCNALFNYPSRNLTVSFIGSSSNAFFNQEAHYRGTNGTMELGVTWLRIFAEARNDLFRQYVDDPAATGFEDLRTTPVLDVPVNYNWSTLEHLDDFFVNAKSRGECKEPVREAFKAMVGVAMAIESYKTNRTVHWDAERERIL